MRDADWVDRHKVAAWSLPGTRMEDSMPVRYSGARAAGEIEVKAVQQLMFREMRSAGNIRSWAQARQWWVAQPPGTLKRWQEAATRVAADMSTKV